LFSAVPATSTLRVWSVRGWAGCCSFSRGHGAAAGPGRSLTGWCRWLVPVDRTLPLLPGGQPIAQGVGKSVIDPRRTRVLRICKLDTGRQRGRDDVTVTTQPAVWALVDALRPLSGTPAHPRPRRTRHRQHQELPNPASVPPPKRSHQPQPPDRRPTLEPQILRTIAGQLLVCELRKVGTRRCPSRAFCRSPVSGNGFRGRWPESVPAA